MSNLTRVPLALIEAKKTSGTVVAAGNGLIIREDPLEAAEFSGTYDSVNGILSISIPNLGKINIEGFSPTSTSNNVISIPGNDGRKGVDGMLGRDGLQGQRGCEGPQGKPGKPGTRGPRGLDGPVGATGATGKQGNKGEDGRIQLYIQSDDPGAVGAGAFWLVP